MVDTVWYIWKDRIYKGLLLEQVHIENEDEHEYYYRVQTHHGMQIKPASSLFDTKEQLVERITKYESLETRYC